MKTKRTRLLALLLCIAVCLTLCACGQNTTSGGDTSSGGTSASAGDDTASKMSEFIDSLQDELDATRNSLGDMMDVQVTARGGSLVYSYQYKEDLGTDNETVAEALEAALDAMESTFVGVLTALREEIPGAESVIVEYLDVNGNIILSKEFK